MICAKVGIVSEKVRYMNHDAKYDLSTPLLDLTVGEFMELQQSIRSKRKIDFIYGYGGLQQLLGCSVSFVAKLRREGTLDEATYQIGQIIMFDRDKVLEIMKRRAREKR